VFVSDSTIEKPGPQAEIRSDPNGRGFLPPLLCYAWTAFPAGVLCAASTVACASTPVDAVGAAGCPTMVASCISMDAMVAACKASSRGNKITVPPEADPNTFPLPQE